MSHSTYNLQCTMHELSFLDIDFTINLLVTIACVA